MKFFNLKNLRKGPLNDHDTMEIDTKENSSSGFGYDFYFVNEYSDL